MSYDYRCDVASKFSSDLVNGILHLFLILLI
jgi:hypothetical protein